MAKKIVADLGIAMLGPFIEDDPCARPLDFLVSMRHLFGTPYRSVNL